MTYTKELYDEGLALRPGMNPIEKLRLISLAMVGASEKIFKDKKHEISKVVIFQKAVALYKYLSSDSPEDAKVVSMTRGNSLHHLLSRSEDDHVWNTSIWPLSTLVYQNAMRNSYTGASPRLPLPKRSTP